MVPIRIGRSVLRGFPVGRRQRIQVVLIGHRGEPGEDVAQIGERIFAVPLTRDDDRVDDRRALAGVGVADEEEVLLLMASSP